MILFLSLLISSFATLSIKNELGELYLTNGEFYNLYLSDYFSGNYLTYSISKTNMTNCEIDIKNKFNFSFKSFQEYSATKPNQSRYNPSLASYASWRNESERLIVGYHQNLIEIYKICLDTGVFQTI